MDFSPLVIGTMNLGTWGANMNTKTLLGFVEGCLSIELNTFDHADIYGDYTTEKDFGAVLKGAPELREKIKLISKCGIRRVSANRPENHIKSYDTSKDYIINSVENSLQALNTEYLDLLLIHRPDYLMDPHEVAEAFEELQQLGKVSAFGVSNFNPSQFDLLNSYFPLVTNQIKISILQLDAFKNGTLEQCIAHKIRPMAWAPMAGGKLFEDQNDPRIKRIREVASELESKYGIGLDALMIAWLLKHPSGIIPITGTTKLERIKSAKQALSINLDREDWYKLWSASTGTELP